MSFPNFLHEDISYLLKSDEAGFWKIVFVV